MPVNCGPLHRGEIPASQLTIEEVALLEIYSRLLSADIVLYHRDEADNISDWCLETAKKATKLYLDEIDPNKE